MACQRRFSLVQDVIYFFSYLASTTQDGTALNKNIFPKYWHFKWRLKNHHMIFTITNAVTSTMIILISFWLTFAQHTATTNDTAIYSVLSTFTFAGLRLSLSLMLVKTSAKSSVPIKTSSVPSQWLEVKGLSKYTIEMIREKNFRSVTTRVTVREVHSLVRINTDLIPTYLAQAWCQGSITEFSPCCKRDGKTSVPIAIN